MTTSASLNKSNADLLRELASFPLSLGGKELLKTGATLAGYALTSYLGGGVLGTLAGAAGSYAVSHLVAEFNPLQSFPLSKVFERTIGLKENPSLIKATSFCLRMGKELIERTPLLIKILGGGSVAFMALDKIGLGATSAPVLSTLIYLFHSFSSRQSVLEKIVGSLVDRVQSEPKAQPTFWKKIQSVALAILSGIASFVVTLAGGYSASTALLVGLIGVLASKVLFNWRAATSSP